MDKRVRSKVDLKDALECWAAEGRLAARYSAKLNAFLAENRKSTQHCWRPPKLLWASSLLLLLASFNIWMQRVPEELHPTCQLTAEGVLCEEVGESGAHTYVMIPEPGLPAQAGSMTEDRSPERSDGGRWYYSTGTSERS